MPNHSFHVAAICTCTLLAAAPQAQADLLINGGFENNSAVDTTYNMSNALFTSTVANVTAFGQAEEVDLIHRDNADLALPPIEGDWGIALHSSSFNDLSDAIALELQPSLTAQHRAGQMFRVEFSAQLATEFDPGTGPLEIGISSSTDSFGTLVHTIDPLEPDTWVNHTADFIATTGFNHLTIRTNRTAGPGVWVHLDDVSLTQIPTPSTIPLLALASLAAFKRRRETTHENEKLPTTYTHCAQSPRTR